MGFIKAGRLRLTHHPRKVAVCAAGIRPQEAAESLVHLTRSDDEDVAEAAYDAMAMAEELSKDE